MKTRSAIQTLVAALLLTAVTHWAGHSQEPLPDDKKKALHRFDPADIFPEEREVPRGRPKRRPRNVGSTVSPGASRAPENPASQSTRLRSFNPDPSPSPTPRTSGATVNPSPAPTLEPTPLVETTPSATPEVTPQVNAVAAVESSGLSSAVAGGDRTDSGEPFPLYFLLTVLGLILFVLIALIIGLKKQLRTP
jgi:hypothetical protein